MILSVIAERLKRRSKDDFKGRHFEAALILQAVCWYLRYPLGTVNLGGAWRAELGRGHRQLGRGLAGGARSGRQPE
jgi:hypothetical protein